MECKDKKNTHRKSGESKKYNNNNEKNQSRSKIFAHRLKSGKITTKEPAV